MKELDLSKQAFDKGCGYYYVYDPTHEMANAAGKVYVHRYNAQKHYKTKLTTTLHVHHKDHNKLNNEPSNLLILEASEHASLHHIGEHIEITCIECGLIFSARVCDGRKYCSHVCANLNKRLIVDVDKDYLQNLVNKMPITEIAKIFGTSDVAVHKRCRLLGVIKKPRGYFLRK